MLLYLMLAASIHYSTSLSNHLVIIIPRIIRVYDSPSLGAISACPALFPCKNALPARNRLGVAQDTCLQESRPLARARRKELNLRDLAAKAQRQQQRNKQ